MSDERERDEFFNVKPFVFPLGAEVRGRERGALEPQPGGIPPLFPDEVKPKIPFVEADPNGIRAEPELELRPAIEILSFETFIGERDEQADPLLGSSDDMILSAGGVLLMYGDGGAGKTTLSVDAAFHLAAGDDWIGLDTGTPLNVILIENEGPRQPFRERLERKAEAWQGSPFAANLHVLKEPWTRFEFSSVEQRQGLAEAVDLLEADVVMIGPLASVGASGAGTPDDVSEFELLIGDLRARASRQFALWIVHHENKSGDVSGAWERWPDTLVHIQAQGNGHTKLVWRKARWASTLHGTSSDLVWREGFSFETADPPDRDLRSEIIAWIEPVGWSTLEEIRKKESGIGAQKDKVRAVLEGLVVEGVLEFAQGAQAGRRHPGAKCWRLRSTIEVDEDEIERLLEKYDGELGG